jgi:hypothetical protein
LFLVNPSGIVFGPNGSVNVGGSVSFTTAQYLRLFDGVNSANFYTNPANDSLANSILTVAAVVDFGFLTVPVNYGFLTQPDQSATITVQGSALSVPSICHWVVFAPGKVVIQAALFQMERSNQHLSARTARFNSSTASPGEFDVATLSRSRTWTGLVYLFWVGLPGAKLEHRRQRQNGLCQRRAARTLSERYRSAPLRAPFERYGVAQPR